jgi:hypothetical protein
MEKKKKGRTSNMVEEKEELNTEVIEETEKTVGGEKEELKVQDYMK